MEDHALSYKRSTLIEVLKERLAEAERKREETKRKQTERNKKVRDQIIELIDTYPSFLISVAASLNESWAAAPGSEAFQLAISGAYGQQGYSTFEPDENIKRLIRVYEKAEDETVSVTVNDEVFAYL